MVVVTVQGSSSGPGPTAEMENEAFVSEVTASDIIQGDVTAVYVKKGIIFRASGKN